MKRYRVMTADPPWQPKDKLPGRGRGASKHYDTLSIDQLARMPSERVTSFRFPQLEDDALFFCWRLSSMQVEVLHLVQEWNFTVKSELVWAKYRPCIECRGEGHGIERAAGAAFHWECDACDGTGCGTPWFGMGRYTRGAHETCLIATRGKMASRIISHKIPSVLHAPVPWDWTRNRAIHSAKPEKFYTDVVEKLSDGHYVELFGRARRPGWTVLGNQVGARRA